MSPIFHLSGIQADFRRASLRCKSRYRNAEAIASLMIALLLFQSCSGCAAPSVPQSSWQAHGPNPYPDNGLNRLRQLRQQCHATAPARTGCFDLHWKTADLKSRIRQLFEIGQLLHMAIADFHARPMTFPD
jgi:hypothetical protein